MRITKNTTLIPIVLLLASLIPGCTAPQEKAQTTILPDSAGGRQNGSIAKRFQEPPSRTAVESAIELSEKYAKLSDEAAVLRQENQDFTAKNQQLKEQVTALETQLRQTQKELGEANDLLIQIHLELNNWKTDVLGFRDEMRDAEKAQLEALLKILKVLGGEVNAESAQQNDTSSPVAAISENEAGEPKPRQTLTSGGSNE